MKAEMATELGDGKAPCSPAHLDLIVSARPSLPLLRQENCMASVVDIEDFRTSDPPSWWVDYGISDRHYARPSGWLRGLRGIAEVMFASDDGPPRPDIVAWLCGETDDYLRRVGGKAALIFRASVFAADWVAPIWSFRLPPLRKMNWVDRTLVLKRWEESPLGLSLFAVKAITSSIWFEHPDVARRSKFDGEPLVS